MCEAFVAPEDVERMEPFYPLHVRICRECLLVQLPAYVDREEIFREYAYFSSFSDSWVEHARRYTEAMIERLDLGPRSLVVELASNDGYLLQHFVARGIPSLGIEPARNVAAAAEARGVPTLTEFFGRALAESLRRERGTADLVIGNNVLAQVPDLNDFVAGVAKVLGESGVVTMEFPHLVRLVHDNQFDTIYHEHFSYFSLGTARRIFAAHGLTLFDVDQIPTHGGSIRIYARHDADETKSVTERVVSLLRHEEELGLDSLPYYESFAGKAQKVRYDLLEFLIDAKRAGKRVVGYGAPGKGNTLLNYCGIRSDLLEFTVDRSTYKHGRFLPGTRIPIHERSWDCPARPSTSQRVEHIRAS